MKTADWYRRNSSKVWTSSKKKLLKKNSRDITKMQRNYKS
jgi:hypothetical protein